MTTIPATALFIPWLSTGERRRRDTDSIRIAVTSHLLKSACGHALLPPIGGRLLPTDPGMPHSPKWILSDAATGRRRSTRPAPRAKPGACASRSRWLTRGTGRGRQGLPNLPAIRRTTQTVFGERLRSSTARSRRRAASGSRRSRRVTVRGTRRPGTLGRSGASGSGGRPDLRHQRCQTFQVDPGKWKRLHAKPNRREVEACLPWLIAEITSLSPGVIVGLGATACQAMLVPKVRITKDRGSTAHWNGYPVVVTYHPSAILRVPDSESRASMMADLVEDLRTAQGRLTGTPSE